MPRNDDMTISEWDSIAAQADHPMNAFEPLRWWRAWIARFKDKAPFLPDYPIGHAAMVESWKSRILDPVHGPRFAKMLLGENGNHNVFTQHVDVLYYHTPPEYIYKYVPSRSGFEHAYTIAFPDGDFPVEAITAYFTRYSRKLDLQSLDRNITNQMLRSAASKLNPELCGVLFSYLCDHKQSIIHTYPDLSKMPESCILRGWYKDFGGAKSNDDVHAAWGSAFRDWWGAKNSADQHQLLHILSHAAIELYLKEYIFDKTVAEYGLEKISRKKVVDIFAHLPELVSSTLLAHIHAFQPLLDSGVLETISNEQTMQTIAKNWLNARIVQDHNVGTNDFALELGL